LDSPSVSAAKPTLTLSPVELLKITPESRTFQNIIYEPRVWGGRGSFSVAFLKFSYISYQIRIYKRILIIPDLKEPTINLENKE
jgi:hypothetical protein